MNLENRSIQQHSDPGNWTKKDFNRENDLLRRAYAAYYSLAPEPQAGPHQMKQREMHPDPYYSWVNKRADGREYVILANMKGPIAVYQVRSRDLLHRLKSFGRSVLECDQLDFSKLD